MLHTEEHAAQQDVDRSIPSFDRRIGNGADRADDARVVEHDVETTERGHRGLDGCFDVSLGSDIAVNIGGHVTELSRERSTGVVLDIGEHHTSAFFDETAYRPRPDTARRTGYYRDFASKSIRHLIVPPRISLRPCPSALDLR